MPKRIQMSRKHPWRVEHPDAVVVDRRTKWGNPARVITSGIGQYRAAHPSLIFPVRRSRATAAADAVEFYRKYISGDPVLTALLRAELAGKDLACWCDLDMPCHADVLLALANSEAADA